MHAVSVRPDDRPDIPLSIYRPRLRLYDFFEVHQRRRAPLVLATVVETQGSTYSKAGALMLIDENGIFQGMLSGGCLEGDLAICAHVVLESGQSQLVTYDLADNDELWGLGVGCDGLMRVLLQPLVSTQAYEPFATMLAVFDGEEAAVVSTIVESNLSSAPLAATFVLVSGELRAFGAVADIAAEVATSAAKFLEGGEQASQSLSRDGGEAQVMHRLIRPAAKLLLLGGGLDAEPLLRYASDMGWKCTVVDHRPGYLEKGDFAVADNVICCAADELASNVELSGYAAAVVMSHHLVSDRDYLAQLAATEIAYIGLLGPAGRRDRLLSDLGAVGSKLEGRLYGPAGLDIGGRGPSAIALSIVAQLQELFARD